MTKQKANDLLTQACALIFEVEAAIKTKNNFAAIPGFHAREAVVNFQNSLINRDASDIAKDKVCGKPS